jgi:hypothetical protein
MNHPHADKLIAIAEGRQMQGRHSPSYEWTNILNALNWGSDYGWENVRIAPETININGREVAKPVAGGIYQLEIRITHEGSVLHARHFLYPPDGSCLKAYEATIEPFKS